METNNILYKCTSRDFATWFGGFAKQMRQHSAMTRAQRRQSGEALRALHEAVFSKVELLQFFLDGSVSLAPMGSDGMHLVAALTAQKENPRPALSCHVSSSLTHLLSGSGSGDHHRDRKKGTRGGSVWDEEVPALERARRLASMSREAFAGLELPREGCSGASVRQCMREAEAREVELGGGLGVSAVRELVKTLLGERDLAEASLSDQQVFWVFGFCATLAESAGEDAMVSLASSAPNRSGAGADTDDEEDEDDDADDDELDEEELEAEGDDDDDDVEEVDDEEADEDEVVASQVQPA